jgi:hypothetical protein
LRLPTSWVPVAFASAVSALIGTIAADSRWLAAIGRYIARTGSIPDFVPFATAPSHGWVNVPVLAELVVHWLQAAGGPRALLLAQVLATMLAFTLIAVDMRRARATDSAATIVLLLLIPATFVPLVAIRAQLFSLALFPLLVLLLREEARRPSRRVWLLVPLIALWSNLHGAVLVGLAVAGAYLLIERARRELPLALGVLLASALAVCATPALWRTPAYYAGVLGNEAARRGFGLWAPLSFTSPFDLVFIACAAVLAVAALRSRPPLWELVGLAGLAALTAQSARGSVWLAFFLATPAALGLRREGSPQGSIVTAPALVLLAVAIVTGVVRGPHESGAQRPLLRKALSAAAGTPILATDLLAEQAALAGGRIWIGNPIDAFRHADQRLYLDWLQGRPSGDPALVKAPRVVLVGPGSEAHRRLARLGGFREVAHDPGGVLYERR